MNKFEHTTIGDMTHDSNKKLGYYLFNNQIYYNKFHVLLEASKSGQITARPDQRDQSIDSQVKWFFNDDGGYK